MLFRSAGESQFYSTYTGPVVYTEQGKFQKVDFPSIEKGKADHVKQATDGWLGLIQHHLSLLGFPRINDNANTSQGELMAILCFIALVRLSVLQSLPPARAQALPPAYWSVRKTSACSQRLRLVWI